MSVFKGLSPVEDHADEDDFAELAEFLGPTAKRCGIHGFIKMRSSSNFDRSCSYDMSRCDGEGWKF